MGSIPPPAPARTGAALDPGVVLAILDRSAGRDLPPEAASAWDAAWIACLTNSPRWAETARREFARVTGDDGVCCEAREGLHGRR